MKTLICIKPYRFALALYAVLGITLSGCGDRGSSIAEKLPNRDVPLDMSAQDASVLLAETPVPSPTATAASNDARTLSTHALELGNLADELYVPYQMKWIQDKTKACNFFLITALCESGYCKSSKPFYRAGDFDDYFFAQGWILISLEDLKKILRNKNSVDVVIQRDPPPGWSAGHVGIPVGLTEWNTLLIAQGNHMEEWNEIIEYGDEYMSSGGFRIFAHY